MSKVFLIHHNRTALAINTLSLVCRHDISGITPMCIGKSAAKSIFIRKNDNHMRMVAYQAATPNFSLGLSGCLAKQCHIKLVVTIIKECLNTAITTPCHMVWITGNTKYKVSESF